MPWFTVSADTPAPIVKTAAKISMVNGNLTCVTKDGEWRLTDHDVGIKPGRVTDAYSGIIESVDMAASDSTQTALIIYI